jgi:hypothetical protein
MAYTDSGRLLPLTADGAGLNFLHIFAHSRSVCWLPNAQKPSRLPMDGRDICNDRGKWPATSRNIASSSHLLEASKRNGSLSGTSSLSTTSWSRVSAEFTLLPLAGRTPSPLNWGAGQYEGAAAAATDTVKGAAQPESAACGSLSPSLSPGGIAERMGDLARIRMRNRCDR